MNYEKLFNILFNILLAFIISTFIFAIYVELNPKMTNIWYRINSEGNKTIQLENLFELMLGPLKYSFYWLPNYFDINYFIHFLVILIIIEFIN